MSWPLLCVAALIAGCAGGTPQPAKVKHAAKDWAGAHLPSAHELMVTLVVVARDEHRARVRLLADGKHYDVRLSQRGGAWHVTGAARYTG